MAMAPCKEYMGVKFQPLLKYYLLKLVDIIYKKGIPKSISADCLVRKTPAASAPLSHKHFPSLCWGRIRHQLQLHSRPQLPAYLPRQVDPKLVVDVQPLPSTISICLFEI